MNRLILLIGIALITCGAALRLVPRWQEEASNHKVAIVSDWNEVRTLSAREGLTDDALAVALRDQGATAVFISADTLEDLAGAHVLTTSRRSDAVDFWDSTSVRLADASTAFRVRRELELRGVRTLEPAKSDSPVLNLTSGRFSDLKEIEVGFDPEDINRVREAGLVPALRLNRDPWMSPDQAELVLQNDPAFSTAGAILFNTDDPPGGRDSLPAWKRWLSSSPALLPLFEFHPSKATVELAHALPSQTIRAHTIPALELKDLSPSEERSRWLRAVTERSCRLLLVHAAPGDSWTDYLGRLAAVKTDLQRGPWTLGWPDGHAGWLPPSAFPLLILSVLAFAIALMTPWWSYLVSRKLPWWKSFIVMSALTVLGGCWAAALAQNSWTRLELMPFRGIKGAFILSWIGSAVLIYGINDLKALLKKPLRRWDLLIGLAAVAVVGYIMIRSGNASASWKSPLEQRFRDAVEGLLIARPRFKEFLFGHPLLILGLFLEQRRRQHRGTVDGRPFLVIGMMGQASIVNTFCHLHSPLWLAFLRSFYGIVIGGALGVVLVRIVSFFAPVAEVE